MFPVSDWGNLYDQDIKQMMTQWLQEFLFRVFVRNGKFHSKHRGDEFDVSGVRASEDMALGDRMLLLHKNHLYLWYDFLKGSARSYGWTHVLHILSI